MNSNKRGLAPIVQMIFITWFLLLQSCVIPIGDSGIYVKGKVMDVHGNTIDGCLLDLYYAKNNALLTSKKVDGDFFTSVRTNPYADEYYIVIVCDDFRHKTGSFKLKERSYYKNPYDVGVIIKK